MTFDSYFGGWYINIAELRAHASSTRIQASGRVAVCLCLSTNEVKTFGGTEERIYAGNKFDFFRLGMHG